MPPKTTQTLSFDAGKTSVLKQSHTHQGHNKRKQLERAPNDDDDDNNMSHDKLLRENNKRMKRIQEKRETEEIFASGQHNRLSGELSTKSIGKIANNKHRANMKTNEKLARETALKNIYAEKFLQPTQQGSIGIEDEKGILTTRHLSQEALYNQASTTVKAKAFTLNSLQYGPYSGEYTQNGSYLLLTGDQGQVNILDWRNGKQIIEHHTQEQIFDACFLQDHTLYALAQKRYVCLYDGQGTKVHHLKTESMQFPRKLQFLPYHFLLVTGTQTGLLSWRDVTTGEIVSTKTTSRGPICALKKNPSNAVIHAGHNSGLVTLWTPNMAKPVVTMNCILGGQINDIAIDDSGNYMYTCGSEGTVKLWDIRKYETVAMKKFHRPVTSCDLSQGGLLGLGMGQDMSVWRTSDFEKLGTNDNKVIDDSYGDDSRHLIGPYLGQTFTGQTIRKVNFVPYEDLLGVGTFGSYKHCIVPGAGAANFDSWEANPFETKTQRQERVVKGLLEKLQPDMITLDTNTFSVMSKKDAKKSYAERLQQEKNSLKHNVDLDRKRMKGKSGSKNAVKRKKIGIVDEKREKLSEYLQEKKELLREKNRQEQRQKQKSANSGVVKSALDRFM